MLCSATVLSIKVASFINVNYFTPFQALQVFLMSLPPHDFVSIILFLLTVWKWQIWHRILHG